MNIFRHEIRANFRSLLIWGLVLAGFNLLLFAVWPSFAEDTARLEDLIAAYPEEFAKVFGLDRISMATPLGFYATEAYFMIIVFGSLYAAILGSSLLAKETDDKTIEFLLARPVTRSQVLASKLLAFVVYILVFNLLIAVVTYLSILAFVEQEYSSRVLFLLLVGPVFAHLTFASLGFLLGLFGRRRAALSVSIGLVMGTYFLNVIAALTKNVEWLAWLSPFKYVDAADIIVNESLNGGYVAVLLAVSLVAIGTTYWFYGRRDITV